jgi:hypothetical protein
MAELILPRWSYTPPYAWTEGPEAADFATLFGFKPEPEQELILDATFAVADDGLPASSEGTTICGRQNLKSAAMEMIGLYWLFVTQEPIIEWSAHEMKTAMVNFNHLQDLIENKPWANRRVYRFFTGQGQPRIEMKDGRVLAFSSRTSKSGRGDLASKKIWDEGLELRPEHVAAADAKSSTYPTQQTIIGSSAGKSYSTVLAGKVKAGRAGKMKRAFYFEWADDPEVGECGLGTECSHVYGLPGCRLDDPDRQRAANPLVDRIRIDGRGLTFAAIQRERVGQPDPLLFARERLGWHDTLRDDAAGIVDRDTWMALAEPDSGGISGEPTFVLQVSPDRKWATILACGRAADGRVHVETTWEPGADGHPVYNRKPGTAWALAWFQERLTPSLPGLGDRRYDHMRVVVLAGSAATTLLPELRKVTGLEILLLPADQLSAACGWITDAVVSKELTHSRDPELSASMLAVRRKFISERVFVFGVRASRGDITCAMAAAIGAWSIASNISYDPLDSLLFTEGLE